MTAQKVPGKCGAQRKPRHWAISVMVAAGCDRYETCRKPILYALELGTVSRTPMLMVDIVAEVSARSSEDRY